MRPMLALIFIAGVACSVYGCDGAHPEVGGARPASPTTLTDHSSSSARSKKPFTWELVEDDGDDSTYRARVPGGWLVMEKSHGSIHSPGITFYPDPKHIWDGGTLPTTDHR